MQPLTDVFQKQFHFFPLRVQTQLCKHCQCTSKINAKYVNIFAGCCWTIIPHLLEVSAEILSANVVTWILTVIWASHFLPAQGSSQKETNGSHLYWICTANMDTKGSSHLVLQPWGWADWAQEPEELTDWSLLSTN